MRKNIAVVGLLAAMAAMGAIVFACGGESPPPNSPSSTGPAPTDTSSAAPAGSSSAAPK